MMSPARTAARIGHLCRAATLSTDAQGRARPGRLLMNHHNTLLKHHPTESISPAPELSNSFKSPGNATRRTLSASWYQSSSLRTPNSAPIVSNSLRNFRIWSTGQGQHSGRAMNGRAHLAFACGPRGDSGQRLDFHAAKNSIVLRQTGHAWPSVARGQNN